MKLSVLIHRNPESGFLEGYVVQECQGRKADKVTIKGRNLLKGRQFTKVDSAVQRCDDVILAEFQLLEPPEIEYVLEEGLKK